MEACTTTLPTPTLAVVDRCQELLIGAREVQLSTSTTVLRSSAVEQEDCSSPKLVLDRAYAEVEGEAP
jgi:hypothetical protein